MTDQRSDDWLERLRAGDQDAFSDLVREHHGAVYRLAQRLLRNADDAQDAVQETFLAAFEGIGKFEGRASPKTWLLSIAYRKGVDRLQRRTDERRNVSGGFDDNELWKVTQNVQPVTDWTTNPEHRFSHAQLNEHLSKALSKLPADSRAVFELRDLQGLSSKEAADVLSLTEGALRVRLHRVRQFLMQELQILFGGTGERQ